MQSYRQALLVLAVLSLAQCSFITVRRPPPLSAQRAGKPEICTRHYAAPVADTILAVPALTLGGYGAAIFFSSCFNQSSSGGYEGLGGNFACAGALVFALAGLGGGAVFVTSAVYGYDNVTIAGQARHPQPRFPHAPPC